MEAILAIVMMKKLSERWKTATKTSTLDVGRAGLRVLGELVGEVLWWIVFHKSGVCQYRSLFKHYVLRAQE